MPLHAPYIAFGLIIRPSSTKYTAYGCVHEQHLGNKLLFGSVDGGGARKGKRAGRAAPMCQACMLCITFSGCPTPLLSEVCKRQGDFHFLTPFDHHLHH